MPPTYAGDSSVPLLRTKLFIPHPRTRRVERPQLFKELDAGCPLTLVSAPAGFGKTTLISDWLRSRQQPVGWLSLDPADSEPRRFLSYLAGAVRDALPGVGDELVAMLRSPQLPGVEALLTPLINELTHRAARLVLVLDDYHVIGHREVHAAVEMLIEHLPPGVRLVIATRTDPPFTLPRMRARGQLRDLRAEHLRFNDEEIFTFLGEIMELTVEREQAAALGERTEGWIAGLQLAAMSLRGQSDVEGFVDAFTESNRYVLDYLADEVLRQQDSATLDFMLATSVAPRFCGTLANALLGSEDAQERLEALEAENLFLVPLDDRRAWYRYHHLFASVLKSQLHKKRAGEEVRQLHRSASDWFYRQGFVDEALEQALQAEDRERALDIVEENASRRLRQGDIGTVMSWFDALPMEWTLSRARTVIDRAITLFIGFRWQEMAQALRAVPELLSGETSDRFAGELAALESFMATAQAEPERAILLARQALALLPEDDALLRTGAAVNLGSALVTTDAYDEARKMLREARRAVRANGDMLSVVVVGHLEGLAEQLRGHLNAALEKYQRTLEQVGGERAGPGVRLLRVGEADIYYEWGELDRARELAERAVELDQGSSPVSVARGLVTLAAVYRGRRDLDRADAVVSRLEALLAEAALGPWELMTQTHRARNWCLAMRAFGDPQAMARLGRWVEEHGLLAAGDVREKLLPDQPKEAALTCAVRFLLVRGEAERALELVSALAAVAREKEWRRVEIEARLLEAQARRESPERALRALGQALELAAPEGFLQVLVDEGPWIAPLLTSSPRLLAELPLEYRTRLVAALELDPAGAGRAASPPRTSDLPEPLSRRELEVLASIAEGHSNSEAGKRLHISASTVKKHLENIYGKLGVHGRVEAIARCRALGLLGEDGV